MHEGVLHGVRITVSILMQSLLDSGPVPYAGYDSLAFLAEQVSHHPPSESDCLSVLLCTLIQFIKLHPSFPYFYLVHATCVCTGVHKD